MPTIKRKCPVCSMEYDADEPRLRFGRETTCSRACSYEQRAREKRAGVEIECAVCGLTVERAPSHVKGKHGANFCSPECHYIGRSLGVSRRVVSQPYRMTIEGRTALSRKAAAEYAAGHTLPFPKTERAACEGLQAIGVPFIYQHVFEWERGAFVADFYFPDRSLVIELDSARVHVRSARHVERDRARDAFLQRAGLRVVRIADDGDTPAMRRAVILVACTPPQ